VTTKIETNNTSSLSVLKKIIFHLDSKRKKDIKFVLFLSILSSLAESVSIAMLIPFISFFVNPDNYLFNKLFKSFFDLLNITSEKDILATVALSFIFIVIISGFIKLKYIKSSNSLSDNITSDFRIKIFSFLLNQDFSYYFKHGSNEIMSNLFQKTNTIGTVTFSSVNIINSILVSVAIISILIINEPFYTPLIIISIVLFFFIIFKIKSSSVLKKGKIIDSNQNIIIDIFQNTVGYLPEVIVYNLRKFFLTTLSKLSIQTSFSSSELRTIGMAPRIYLETFVIVFVIIVFYFSGFADRSIEINISYIAILAFGTQKCLPLMNQIYILSINFKGAVPIINSFLKILNEGGVEPIKDQEYKALEFNKKIQLENVSFKYNKNSTKILHNLNLDIIKGEKVAIKGQTGSGKSTLVNIILGLITPSEGKIFIDNTMLSLGNLQKWQKNIAIVPQTVFLNDSTVLENIAIALDVDSIDLEKVKKTAKLAQIDTFIESLPNKYNEKVGERGIRISGGQRQRIGIARALYRDAKVIILDEPTNALDVETEKLVMESITRVSKDITFIMISHSDASLKYFDKIIDLDKLK
jgi:ABC-type bacteriocin/lantibiotic exporter with double-glycine peptidase domain